MNCSVMRRLGISVLVGFLSVLLGGNPGSAGLIVNFPEPGAPNYPDFFSKINSINYNAGTDALAIVGLPQNAKISDILEYNDFLSSPMPTFSIIADITSAGTIGGGGGTLSITGKSISLGNSDTNLLSGVLEQFGFNQTIPNKNGRFEFIFGSLTGVLAPYFANGKAHALVTAVQDSGTAYDGTFNADFFFSGTGAKLNSDTLGVPIPEPSTATLAGLALAALLGISRARRR